MRMGSVFSKHLKADDLGTAKPVVTIDRVEMEKVGDDTKPVLYFLNKDKGLVLNVTNTNAIIDILGTDESDEWTGRRVQLYATKVDYAGKRVLAIRVQEAPASTSRQPVKPVPPPEPVVSEDITEDEIPFAWMMPFVLPALGLLGLGVILA